MSDRQDLDRRNAVTEPVQSNVAGSSAGNHEFADVAAHGAADEWVVARDARRGVEPSARTLERARKARGEAEAKKSKADATTDGQREEEQESGERFYSFLSLSSLPFSAPALPRHLGEAAVETSAGSGVGWWRGRGREKGQCFSFFSSIGLGFSIDFSSLIKIGSFFPSIFGSIFSVLVSFRVQPDIYNKGP